MAGNSKIIYGGNVLIDLTADTITPQDVLNSKIFHMADGSVTTGTNTFNADTSDANAQDSEILYGRTAYVNGNKITGSMPNVGAQTSSITTKAQQIAISQGYHDGSGKVSIDSTEQSKIIAENIKSGVSILGVAGSYTGSELIKTVPSASTVVYPSATTDLIFVPTDYGDYNSIAQFTVKKIVATTTVNEQGGITWTIAS